MPRKMVRRASTQPKPKLLAPQLDQDSPLVEEWLSPRYLAIRKKYDTIQELYTAQKLLPLAGRVLEWDASFSVRSKFMRKPDYRRVVVLKKLRQLARMMEKLEPGEREGQARIAELYAAEGWDFPE